MYFHPENIKFLKTNLIDILIKMGKYKSVMWMPWHQKAMKDVA